MQRRLLCTLTVLMLVAAACGEATTPIGKIVQNPRDYDGRQVAVSGEVVEVFSLFVVKYFMLRDSSGEIVVITPRPLPKKGTRLKVRGNIQEAFSLADRQLLVLIETEAER